MKLVLPWICVVQLAIAGCDKSTATKPIAPTQADQKEIAPAESTTAQSTPQTADTVKSDTATPTTEVISTPDQPFPATANATSTQPASKETKSDNPSTTTDDGSPKPIDLSAFYALKVPEFANTGHSFPHLPNGKQQFGKVPVDIGGLLFLWGRNHASRGEVYPEFVEAIPVGRKFESLYLYHFTRWKTSDGSPVANIILNYDTGEPSSHELRYGEHLRDWHWKEGDPDAITDRPSKKVWQAENPADPNTLLLVYITELKNPRPNDKVASLDLVSALGETVWTTMAITTGPAGLLKEESAAK